MKTLIWIPLFIAVVLISGCGKQSTREQTFDNIIAIVRDIESGKRSEDALNEYFYRSPREKEGFVVVERIKMRALNQVILSRITSDSFVNNTSIDAFTVELAIHYTYKDPGGSVGTGRDTFVFVKDGREWKLDCGPR